MLARLWNCVVNRQTCGKRHFSQKEVFLFHFNLHPFILIYTPSTETLITPINIEPLKVDICGFGSSVGIVTDYGLDGPGSSPGEERDFPLL